MTARIFRHFLHAVENACNAILSGKAKAMISGLVKTLVKKALLNSPIQRLQVTPRPNFQLPSIRLSENGWERGEGEPRPTPISAISVLLGCIKCRRLPRILPRVFPFLSSENHVAHLEKTLVR